MRQELTTLRQIFRVTFDRGDFEAGERVGWSGGEGMIYVFFDLPAGWQT